MPYSFEEFANIGAKSTNSISITKSLSFGFSNNFYKEHSINEFQYVVLFYDHQNKAIGFLFTNDKDRPNKYKLSHSKTQKSGYVIARAFFKAYNIDVQKIHGKYPPSEIEIKDVGKLFIIDIQ